MSNLPVLLIATESYAGMGPYVASIINGFKPDDNIRFLVVDGASQYFHKNIKPELIPLTIFIISKPKNPYKKLQELLFDYKTPVIAQILEVVKKEKFKVIHSLNSLTSVQLVKTLNQEASVIYTIHDFYHHEIKKAWHKMWRQLILNKRVSKARNITDFWITNSFTQLEDQKSLYPNKTHFYFPFPTLITDIIANGKQDVAELQTVNRYILFFGRIEAYKGVENLIHAFEKANLPEDIKLVIAGKGSLSYNPKNNRIIYLNRYIQDEEIAYLYCKSSCIVYPYISATQSGVLSIATYFDKPILSSNLPFFREILGKNYQGFFKPNNIEDLRLKLESFFNNELTFNQDSVSAKIYNKFYSENTIREHLLGIYSQF